MDLYSHLINSEFDYFHNYRDFIFNNSNRYNDKLQKTLEALKKDQKENPELLDTDSEERVKQTIFYESHRTEQIMMRSFVVSMFGFVESLMYELCDVVRRSNHSNFSYKDMKGSGINRAFYYLKKILGSEFPTISHLNNKLKAYQAIRNLIVHNDSQVVGAPSEKDIVAFQKVNNDFSLTGLGELVLTENFVNNFFGTMQGIWGNIMSVRAEEISKMHSR